MSLEEIDLATSIQRHVGHFVKAGVVSLADWLGSSSVGRGGQPLSSLFILRAVPGAESEMGGCVSLGRSESSQMPHRSRHSGWHRSALAVLLYWSTCS